MKTLMESLYKVGHIFEAYNTILDDLTELNAHCKVWVEYVKDTDKTEIIKWITQIFGEDAYVIVSDGKEAFKIPRYLSDAIDKTVKDGNIPSCLRVDLNGKYPTDRTIYYIDSGGKRHKLALTGSGSVGRVRTAQQELATCYIWNAFVKELDGANSAKFEMTDEVIKLTIADLAENMDNSWIKSFREQIIAILKFLESQGIKDPKDIAKYRACRFGGDDYVDDDGNEKYFNTGKAHEEFVKKYMELITSSSESSIRVQKDNYDPSDILLYIPGKGVLGEFKKLMGDIDKMVKKDSNVACDMYRKLFKEKLLFGISLKKCEGKGTYDLFNITEQSNNSVVIKSVENVSSETANNCKLKVTGTFNFSGVSDPEQPGYNLREDEVFVTVRSFGKANGMDIMKTSGPAIGKVPVRMWTEALGVKSEDLKGAIEQLKTFTDKSKYKELTKLIQGGIKNGPWCLPFVLIH